VHKIPSLGRILSQFKPTHSLIKVTWSVSLMHCSVTLWRARKPNCIALSRTLSSMCLLTIFRVTFSNSLHPVDKRLIGRKFWGNCGSLPGFIKVITFDSFQEFRKWGCRKQWLNTCVGYTSGLLGRCLRASFGIPSSSQAFLNFNVFANLCMLQGLTSPTGFRIQMRAELGLYSPFVAHGFRHTLHEMWTRFLNNPQSLWLSPSGDILLLKGHEQRPVDLIHTIS
jgi:hypothetical protein